MEENEKPASKRLDIYVQSKISGISRAFGSKLIERGKVLVNGKAETKSGYSLKKEDKVSIDFTETDSVIPKIDIPIIYKDKDCLVIDKPLGVLTHSKGAFNPEGTVASWLKSYVADIDSGDRAGIVHRLDRATSGVMICARNKEALLWLQKQFSQRKTKKTYIAIVEGELDQDEAIINMPIERNPKKPQTFRVGSNGKPASTQYKVLSTNQMYSLVELKPTTGRTHQLRVHLKQINHPILGDTLYGGKTADRMFLHALSLEITLPSKERKVFEAKLPKIFAEIMKS